MLLLHDEMQLSDANACLYVIESPLYNHQTAQPTPSGASMHTQHQMIRQGDPVVFRQHGASGAFLCRDLSTKWADVEKKKTRLGISNQMLPETHFCIRTKYETSSEHVLYYQSQVTIAHVSSGLGLHVAPSHCLYGNLGVEDYHLTKRVEVNLAQPKPGVPSDDSGSFLWRFRRFDKASASSSNTTDGGSSSMDGRDSSLSTGILGESDNDREREESLMGVSDSTRGENGVSSSDLEADSATIRVGACVRLSNQCVNGYLWGSCDNAVFETNILRRDQEMQRLQQHNAGAGAGASLASGGDTLGGNVDTAGSNGSNGSGSGSGSSDRLPLPAFFFNKPPEFCLNDPVAALSPKSIFVIERASCLLGGEVRWDGYYRLRHLVSNCYLSVKQSSSQNFELYLSSLVKPAMHPSQISYEAKLQYVSSSLFQFDSMVHEEAMGTTMTWKNSTIRLLHRFMKIPSSSEVACRLQLKQLLQGSSSMEFHATPPVALILGVQRPRTMKYCTPVMGAPAAALPRQKLHRTVMHKVSLMFSKQCNESDIYDVRRISGQASLLQNIHQMKLIHLALDNLEAALCMFISGSGASRASLSDDTCREALAALSSILDFVRGPPEASNPVGGRGVGGFSTFQSIQEKRSNQILCAKLGIIDRLFCIMSLPLVMGGKSSRTALCVWYWYCYLSLLRFSVNLF